MLNFLENISRYPRFFISSFVGLLSIIMRPLIFFINRHPNNIIKIFFFLSFLLLLSLILQKMLDI